MAMKWYRKLPLTVRAEQFVDEEQALTPVYENGDNTYYFQFGETKVPFKLGDYVIIDIDGNPYPCCKNIFEASYREVE